LDTEPNNQDALNELLKDKGAAIVSAIDLLEEAQDWIIVASVGQLYKVMANHGNTELHLLKCGEEVVLQHIENIGDVGMEEE